MARNHLVQDVRNFVAHHVLGLAPVQHRLADRLSEIAIGYPDSPLNAGSGKGPEGPGPGERILMGPAFGAGDTPRFALLAKDGSEARAVLRDHAGLLEPTLRAPPGEAGIWLVRPDGYVAAAVRAGEWHVIRDCLVKIAPGRP
jgi:hypothetical protein